MNGRVGPDRKEDVRVPILDGLRGLAIALVLMMHVPAELLGGSLHRLASMGWIGVDLFFVLSGFLITGILLDTRNTPTYFSSFYARRVLRIFPLYYGFLVALLLLPRTSDLSSWLGADYVAAHRWWFFTYTSNWLTALEPTHAGMASGVGHLWSLAIEEQFYIVWPMVVALATRHTLTLILAAILAGGLVLRLGLALLGADIYVLYHLTLTRLDPLAVGALLAILARRGGLARYRVAWSWSVVAVAACVGLGVILVAGHPKREALIFALTIPAVAAAWGIVLLRTLARGAPTRSWLDTAPMRALGKYSYAIYLFAPGVEHILGGVGLGPTGVGPGIAFLLTVSATIGVAVLSWHLFERRILSLKRWFPRGGKSGPESAAYVTSKSADDR